MIKNIVSRIIILIFMLQTIGCNESLSSPTPLPQPSETTQTTSSFTHPRQFYSLQFPLGWHVEVIAHEGGDEEISFTSPDYQISSGYPILEKGAEFLIITKPIPENTTSVKDYFHSNSLIQDIAQNCVDLDVAGYPAIQFNYSYEGVAATMTLLIANSRLLQIRYRYVDPSAKSEFLNEYHNLLDSMTISNNK